MILWDISSKNNLILEKINEYSVKEEKKVEEVQVGIEKKDISQLNN